MAIQALSKKKRPYILKEDRASANPTIFYIRNIDRHELANLQVGKKPENPAEQTDLYFNMGLLGWDNFPDSDGEMVPFSPENFRLIKPKDADELLFEIVGIVSKEEEKNSAGQSLSQSGSPETPTRTSGTA